MALISIFQFIFSILDGNFCVFQFRSIWIDFVMNFFVHVPGTHLWGIYLQNISDFREDISSDFLGIARLLFKVVIPIYTSTSSI